MILMGSLPHAADSCGDVERVFFLRTALRGKSIRGKGRASSMKALTADEMREVDHLTTVRFGIPGDQLMEAAGKSVVDVFLEQYGYKSGKPPGRVCVFCGKGNNGGDGFVAARHLKEEAEQVEVYLFAAAKELQTLEGRGRESTRERDAEAVGEGAQ